MVFSYHLEPGAPITYGVPGMKLVFEHFFDSPPERLFAFYERTENIAVLQRAWKSFKLVSHSAKVREGGSKSKYPAAPQGRRLPTRIALDL